MNDKKNLKKVLDAIADGYAYTIEDDCDGNWLIVVQDPSYYYPWDDPCLVHEVVK